MVDSRVPFKEIESHHKRKGMKERKSGSINIVLPASSILPISVAGLIGLVIRMKVHRHQMYRGISKDSEGNVFYI
jgi:hypothetical protein